jgi:hypothetical protein
MPRQQKPIPILRVEGLSDGMPQDIGPALVDDFTGEVIPRVWPAQAPKAIPSAQALRDAANREKHRINQLLLQAAGIIPKSADPAGVHACSQASEPAGPSSTGATPKASGRKFTKLVLTRKPQDWRRI